VNVHPLNIDSLFRNAASYAEISHAVGTYGSWLPRPLSAAEAEDERQTSLLVLAETYGPAGAKDFRRFADTQERIMLAATMCNVVSHPAFALAVVRAVRAEEKCPHCGRGGKQP
jgi:hypothetical protein